MKRERSEFLNIVKTLNGDLAGRRKALEYVHDSDVWVHGAPAPFPFVPYFFNSSDWAFISQTCAITHRILEKVISFYLQNPSYRGVFGFAPEVERLICLPCGYDELLPMARFDYFLDEDDRSFTFCEFNTDGSGAMSRDFEIGQALMLSESFERFASQHKVRQFELFDSWVETFLRIYATNKDAHPRPHVAIVDFRGSTVLSDTVRFLEAFRRAGIAARFVDVTELAFDGRRLTDPNDGWPIDAIYRRAVTSEIVKHPGQCDALLDAVATEKVCLIGHFRTTVVHSKMVSVALFDKTWRHEILSNEECKFVDAHVLPTYRLLSDGSIDLDAIRADKDSWIIKPADDYAAHDVFPGMDFTQDEFNCIVTECLDADFIIQKFYPPHQVNIINSALPAQGQDPCSIESWQSMPGFYVYDGHAVGCYARLGRGGIIAIDHGGLCSASFQVKD